MSIKLLCLGKTKQDFIKKGIQEYLKRISLYGNLKIKILADEKLTAKKGIIQIKKKEAETIFKEIDDSDYVIALDEHGKQLTSVQFAKLLKEKLNYHNLVFVVGGVYGLARTVLNRANMVMSFSNLTFTHQMARLIFLEQLYRAYTIINNKKYHY
ncbi:MAG: 23S rRNA (pseudouridine(1915)-N(3))-methyltransferase RlmH [Candidatus Cloacimonadota bacterium]|nr:23S rRNA (pseudouridine(1915)-N(3))-methyltransferase RlmH [Candidatus Cloacimonadota bacterium]